MRFWKWEVKKRRGFALLLAVELAILCLLAWNLVRADRSVQTIPYRDIVGTTIPDDRNGWYVDDTFPLADDGLFDMTAEQHMDPGVYEITVNYESDTYDNYTTVGATTKTCNALLADNVKLPGKLTHVTYSVWLLDSTEDFQVKNYYAGSGYLIIRDITIARTSQLERMCLFTVFVVFFLLDLIVAGVASEGSLSNLLYRRRMLLLLLAAAIVVSAPELSGGITHGDDIGFHLLRIEGLARSIREGILPCKLQTNWDYGYGYAVSVFYGDLFLTIPAILRIIGFPVGFSYNVFLFLIHLAGLISVYWCCRKLSGGRIASFACAFVYAACPYPLIGTYYRNALGETQAMAFLPLIVYGILTILTRDPSSREFRRAWIPAVIGFTGIIESHMLSCVICGEFLVLLLLVSIRKVLEKKRFFQLVKTAGITLALNAWFLLPMLSAYHSLAINQPYRNALRIQANGAEWGDLFSWFWGVDLAGVSELAYGTNTYSIGAACGIVLLLFLLLYTKDHSDAGKKVIPKAMLHLWLASVLSLWMATKYFPWDNICDLLGDHATLVVNIQFQVRYLAVAAVMSPFLMCAVLSAMKAYWGESVKKAAAVGLAMLAFVNVYPQLSQMPVMKIYDIGELGRTDICMAEYLYNKDVEYTSEDFMANKIDPEYAYVPGTVKTGDGVTWSDLSQEKLSMTLTCANNSEEKSWVELPLLYYEQYRAEDAEGNALTAEAGDLNVVRVILPAGYQGEITVTYIYPTGWILSEVLSLAALAGLIVLAVRNRRDKVRS